MTEPLARLFPLPHLLLFPGTVVPLHIFEPRYRDLVDAALAGNRRLALFLLEPGHEKDYQGSPPIHPVGCLGRIVDHFRLPDGRFNIAVLGLERIRILEEIPGRSYRRARYESLVEEPTAIENPVLERFLDLLHIVICRSPGALRQIDFSPGDIRLPGLLADKAAAALRLDAEIRQAYLEETHLGRRIERMTTDLEQLIEEHLRPRLGPWNGPFHFDRS